MADLSPPVAFHFTVSIEGISDSSVGASFQEVSGLETAVTGEPIAEGGENGFVHQLPVPTKHAILKLKRGISSASGNLISWARQTLEWDISKPIEARTLLIKLLNENGDSVAIWRITGAYPVKFSVGNFDAMKNVLSIETIECAYHSIKRIL